MIRTNTLTEQQQSELSECLRAQEDLQAKQMNCGLTTEQADTLNYFFRRRRQLLAKLRKEDA